MNLGNNVNSSFQLAVGSSKPKRGTFALRLTSMIDMFTILLVFLLKSYSAEGQIMTITKDLRLPESTATKPPSIASVVAINREWILLDGRPVEEIKNIESDDNLLIECLYNELKKLRDLTVGIGQLSENMVGFRGTIAIQGDKELPFSLLKRIMLTCGQVGYNNMLLAVTMLE
jgi:biopolymer transport protein ExbD